MPREPIAPMYGYDAKGVPIHAFNEEGRPICGARYNNGQICHRIQRLATANGRCHLHSNRHPAGADSNQLKHGKYSRHLPKSFAELLEAGKNNPEVLRLEADIALLDSRKIEIMRKMYSCMIEDGEFTSLSPEDLENLEEAGAEFEIEKFLGKSTFRNLSKLGSTLDKQLKDLVKEHGKNDELEAVIYTIRQMRAQIERESNVSDGWAEILKIDEIKSKMMKMQSDNNHRDSKAIPASIVFTVFRGIMNVVGRYVTDKTVQHQLHAEITQLLRGKLVYEHFSDVNSSTQDFNASNNLKVSILPAVPVGRPPAPKQTARDIDFDDILANGEVVKDA